VVQVFDPKNPLPVPPAIHPAFWPTENIRAGDPVTFKVRTFGVKPDEGKETWDFGDGSAADETQSDGNVKQHNPDGYAKTVHRYKKPSNYSVTVKRSNNKGKEAVGRLWVKIEK
jgi:PKD repeat protein